MKRGNKRKFSRERNQRKALYKGLATALIEKGKIKTTAAKAKSLSTFFDKMVTVAKKSTRPGQTLASRRLLQSQVGDKAVKKLVTEIAPSFEGRKGGYTRVIRLGQRKSDSAPMALIELTK